MLQFKISFPSKEGEIFRTFYLSENNSNIPLLEVIKTIWEPLVTPLGFSEAHKFKKELIEGLWRIALAWVVKEQLEIFTEEDYPFTEVEYKALKPWGLLLKAQLDLCKGCCERFSQEVFPYSSGEHCWQEILLEQKNYIISNISEETKLNDKKNSKKRGLVVEPMRRKLALMESGNNIFPKNDPNTRHNHKLIAAALVISKGHPSDIEDIKNDREKFREKYWNPYKIAYQNWINHIHGSNVLKFYFVVSDEDKNGNKIYKVFAQINGRQTRRLFPIYKKPTLTRRGKYPRKR